MMVHPATVFIGDTTPFGVVASVKSTRHNIRTTITFEDGSKRDFTRFEEVEILDAGTML